LPVWPGGVDDAGTSAAAEFRIGDQRTAAQRLPRSGEHLAWCDPSRSGQQRGGCGTAFGGGVNEARQQRREFPDALVHPRLATLGELGHSGQVT